MAAGITRYTVALADELSRLPDIDLRLLTTISFEIVAAIAEERGYPKAQSVQTRLPRSLQYLTWHIGGSYAQRDALFSEADILHTPTFLVPPRKKSRLVVTVHDLSLLRFPQYHPRNTRILMGTGLRRAVQDADAFLAVSEYTKQDLIRLTGVSSDRIYVTPEAADSRFVPVLDAEILVRHQIQSPYLLYVGTLEPRKNIGVLLRAFAAMKEKDCILVLAGAKGWMYNSIFVDIDQMGIKDRVKAIGYVADGDLPALYTQARAFVYPSLFEGFGLPVLEAMQCGTPVITTNVSSLPEVAGQAAILFAPDDVAGLTQALDRVVSVAGVHEELKGRSLEQAGRFSWRHTAELTAEAYRLAMR